jgi:hypothetical protein
MNKETQFLIKVLRNAFILSALYFISVFASGNLSWSVCKPVVVFLATYVFTELAKHYKLDYTPKGKKAYATLVY